ncbi:phage tail assembly chaperone [Cucumibacter marinus]|uniref:phage tail assembly chaperone n=1 Tax=Cucumibacter marinus TaxID=1121252 RepID=UPI00138AD863|nr:hypothetical protein [Cucumibacter marinus]
MNRDTFLKSMAGEVERCLRTSQAPHMMPGSALYWEVFAGLNLVRVFDQSGPRPISYSDVHSYLSLHRLPLGPAHIEVIFVMDRAFREHFASRQQKPNIGLHAMTPAIFDAVFS